MKVSVAIDSSFILSIILKRKQTEKALRALSEAQARYDELYLPKQVIGEVVYVLEGIHRYTPQRKRLSRMQIRDYVLSILNTPKIDCEDQEEVVEALGLYVKKRLSFGDALIAANVTKRGIGQILSFDEDLRKIEGLKVCP